MTTLKITTLKITCNKRKRDCVIYAELPEKAQRDFDYAKDDDWTLRFVKYKGQWIDVQDVQAIRIEDGGPRTFDWAMYVSPDSPFAPWHAITSDSAFSGLLIRYCDDNQVQIGRFSA